MKHTPGPWKIAGFAGQHEETGAKIVDSSDKTIASTWGGLQEISPIEEWRRYHADAELIASAPKLEEENEQLKQDINDLIQYLGDIVRGPCGHLRVHGFICPCRADHSLVKDGKLNKETSR